MRYTKAEMIIIASRAEARCENPKYKNIMEKFDRVLAGKTKNVRLNTNEKDLISYMVEDKPEIVAKIYK